MTRRSAAVASKKQKSQTLKKALNAPQLFSIGGAFGGAF
nr:MAG TPA: hypothetical protein [Caudoviricetes sp.]